MLYYISPTLTAITAAIILIAIALIYPAARLLVFSLGGLFLFDSGQSLAPKAAYMVLSVCFVARGFNPPNTLSARTRGITRRVLTISAVYAVGVWLLLVPFAIHWQSVTPSAAIRDAITLTTPALAIAIGIDAGYRANPRAVLPTISVIAAVAVVQYTITWQSRRGITSDATYVLGSRSLVTLAFVLALTVALFRSRYLVIGSLAVVTITAAAMLSGNRSTVTMFAAAPIVILLAVRKLGGPVRTILSLCGAAIGIATFVYFILPMLPNAGIIQRRMATVTALLRGSDPTDASAVERQQITQQAMSTWAQHPLLGAGIGSTTRVDSVALYLSKFGLIGTSSIASYFGVTMGSLARLAKSSGATLAICLGWIVATLFSLVSSMPTSDQGLSISVALIGAVAASTAAYGEEWLQ